MAELEDTAGPMAEAVRDKMDSGVQDFPTANRVMEGDGDYSSGDSPEDEVTDEGDDTDVDEDEPNNAVHRQRRSNKNNQSMKEAEGQLLDTIDKEESLNDKAMAELEDMAEPMADAVKDLKDYDLENENFPTADRVTEGDESSGDLPEGEVTDSGEEPPADAVKDRKDNGLMDFPNVDAVMEGNEAVDGDDDADNNEEVSGDDEGDDTDAEEDEPDNAVHRQRRSNENDQSIKQAEGQLLDTIDKEESLNEKAMAELEDMAEPMADAVKDLKDYELEKENFPTADRVMEGDESSGDPPEDEVTDSEEQPPADAVRDRMDQGLQDLPTADRVMEGEESSGASGDKGADDVDDEPNNAVQRQRRSNENNQYLKQTESELFDLIDNEETLNNKAMAELEDTAEPMADAVKDREVLRFGEDGEDGVVPENDEAGDLKGGEAGTPAKDGVEEVEVEDVPMNDEVGAAEGGEGVVPLIDEEGVVEGEEVGEPLNDEEGVVEGGEGVVLENDEAGDLKGGEAGAPAKDEVEELNFVNLNEGVPLIDEGAVVEREEVGEPLNDEGGVEEGEGETPENDEGQIIEGGEGNDTPDVTNW